MSRNLQNRLKKLESNAIDDDQYMRWLQTLTDDELYDAMARTMVECELKVELDPNDPSNQAALIRLQEDWAPPINLKEYEHLSDADLEAELKTVKERGEFIRTDENKAKLEDFKAKWRYFYLNGVKIS